MDLAEIKRLDAQAEKLENEIQDSGISDELQRFYCPILHVEEDAELCRGHIRPKSVGGRDWVVQRKDVDNFFGWFAEADFNHGVKLRSMEFDDAIKYVLDKKLAAPANLTMIDDEGYEATIRPTRIVEGMPEVVARPKQSEFNREGPKKTSIDFDVSFETLLSCLHSAHLGLFKTNRYRYVFSAGGDYTASLLGNVFRRFSKARMNRKRNLEAERRDLEEICQCHRNMVRPVLGPEVFNKELREHPFRSFVVCWCDGFPFASMHLLQADQEWNAVMVYEGVNPAAIAHIVSDSPLSFKVTLARFHETYMEVGPLKPDSMTVDWPCGTSSEGMQPYPIEGAVQFLKSNGLI